MSPVGKSSLAVWPVVHFGCKAKGCDKVYSRKDELGRHYRKVHSDAPTWDSKKHAEEIPFLDWIQKNALYPLLQHLKNTMDESSGRGRREKFPSARIKEHVIGQVGKAEEGERVILPNYVAGNDPKLCMEPKEIAKSYHHTKVLPDGEKFDFYRLTGPHVESKDRRYYIRAQRDPETFYFHAAEVPPCRARLSDENHQQCAADKTMSLFTKDMLGKTGEWGQYTTRANVFAREGTFCFEAKIVANNDEQTELPDLPLAQLQNQDLEDTNRGSVRIGFCRREHMWSETLGSNCYSYAVVSRANNVGEYGNARFNSKIYRVEPDNPGQLKRGDVVGLMITLPSLAVHKKVVEGTFNPAEYPDLECGPMTNKSKKQSSSKKGGKAGSKAKETEQSKEKEKEESAKELDYRSQIRKNLRLLIGHDITYDHDILRDRNPFLHKDVVYFECPDYTPRPDLMRKGTRGQTNNPDTGHPYDPTTDTHPNHELDHLRTLPGSKIEMWVNGKYKGIVAKHLLAFLPPASYIEKSTKTANLYGNVDDGLLGYYPALSTYSGGAAQLKFDGDWWYGFDVGPDHDARPFGERYNEQIVDDYSCDVVDETYHENLFGDPDWMKKRVLNAIDLAPVLRHET